jgi:serine O-acetyltransferase
VNNDLDHCNLPDPVAEICRSLSNEISELKKEVAELKRKLKETEEKQGGTTNNDRPALQYIDEK